MTVSVYRPPSSRSPYRTAVEVFGAPGAESRISPRGTRIRSAPAASRNTTSPSPVRAGVSPVVRTGKDQVLPACGPARTSSSLTPPVIAVTDRSVSGRIDG